MTRARLGLLVAALAIAIAFAFAGHRLAPRTHPRADAAAPPAARAAEAAPRGVETVDAPLGEGGRTRAAAAPAPAEPDPAEGARVAAQPAPAEASATIAGRAVLLDGAPAARVLLEAIPQVTSRSRPLAATTDDRGAFELAVHDPGAHRFLARTQLVLEAQGEHARGARDARVTLLGYAVGLRALLPDGRPAGRAAIHVRVRGVDGSEREAVLRADAEGLARLHSPVAATVEAYAVAQGAPLRGQRSDVFVGAGTSATVEDVRLMESDGRGALRVEVRCADGGCATPFSFHLADATTGTSIGWFSSEDLGPDGVLYGLPSGEAEVRLAWRLRDPPAFYPDPRRLGGSTRRVTLAEGRIETASFVEPCLGRIALHLARADVPAGAEVDGAVATLTSPDGAARRLSAILPHDDGGWTSSSTFDWNRRRIAEEAIEPGVYRLTITVARAAAWSGDVEIEACGTAEVEIRL